MGVPLEISFTTVISLLFEFKVRDAIVAGRTYRSSPATVGAVVESILKKISADPFLFSTSTTPYDWVITRRSYCWFIINCCNHLIVLLFIYFSVQPVS